MTNLHATLTNLSLGGLMVAGALAPALAPALGPSVSPAVYGQRGHRQKQKNQWRNLGLAGAGAAILGLLTHDSALTAVGVVGGLYSTYRYEQDRKSQNAARRRRAAFFSRRKIVLHGHHYNRVVVTKHGHKYYAFKRA